MAPRIVHVADWPIRRGTIRLVGPAEKLQAPIAVNGCVLIATLVERNVPVMDQRDRII